MPDATLLPAIKEALKQNEIGDASPYCLSFAKFGQSGASFGVFQGDTNVSLDARNTLTAVLRGNGIDASSIARIVTLLAQPCPNGNPLSQSDTGLVAAALDSSQGHATIDAMDDRLLKIVLDELQSSLDAAAAARLGIEPIAQLYIALWVNMTGQPTSLNRWVGGANVGNNVACPAPPAVTQDDITAYLKASKYFVLHPRNFVHMHDSVDAALRLLPTN